MTANDIKNKLAAQANKDRKPQTPANPKQQVAELLKKYQIEIERVLPKHLDPDRLLRIATTAINKNPLLLQCSQMSLLSAVMQTAQLGLEPDMLGQAYFVPFKNGQKGIYEVQYIIGYKGLIKLARNSGEVSSIYAHEVYQNDEFEFKYGLEKDLIHKPEIFSSRGEVIAYYAVIRYKDGGYDFLVMSRQEIERRKAYSKAAASKASPWNNVDHYHEMAKKTVLRALLKTSPLSAEVMTQIEGADETVKNKLDKNMAEVENDLIIDITDFTMEKPEDEQAENNNEEAANNDK